MKMEIFRVRTLLCHLAFARLFLGKLRFLAFQPAAKRKTIKIDISIEEPPPELYYYEFLRQAALLNIILLKSMCY